MKNSSVLVVGVIALQIGCSGGKTKSDAAGGNDAPARDGADAVTEDVPSAADVPGNDLLGDDAASDARDAALPDAVTPADLAAQDADEPIDAASPDAPHVLPGGPIAFEVGRLFPAHFSSSIRFADVTGDGIPDLVGLNVWDGLIEVKPGDGKGGFSTAITSPHNHGQPAIFVLCDFDRDGDLDVGLPGTQKIDWFQNDGTGHLTAAATTDFPAALGGIEMADVNKDGCDDVVSNWYGTITVYLANASGGFSTTGLTSTCLTAYTTGVSMGIADFDRDENVDLVLSLSLQVAICRGDGTGHFTATAADRTTFSVRPGGSTQSHVQVSEAAGSPPRIAFSYDSEVQLFDDIRNEAPVNWTTFTIPYRATFVGPTDLNGDGLADALVRTSDGGSYYELRVYLGQPAGGLALANSYSWSGGGLLLGDVNGDRVPDVICNDGFSLTILMGRGDGSLRAAPIWPAGVAGWSTQIVDITRDGRPDVISLSTSGSSSPSFSVRILVGQSDGRWTQGSSRTIQGIQRSMAVADLNGDGLLDVVVSRESPNELDLLAVDAQGNLAEPTKIADSNRGRLSAHDVDGDGKPDLLHSQTDLRLYSSKTGTWHTIATFDWIAWHVARDFDGDGKADILVANVKGDVESLQYLQGRGDGTFEDAVITSQSVGYVIDVADLDQDGDLDLVNELNGVSAFMFDQRHFGPPVNTSSPDLAYARTLQLADFDADGVPDLAFSGGYGLVVHRGDGRGGFTDVYRFPSQMGPQSFTVGDMDGDGRPDIVGNGQGVFWARNITGLQ